MDLKDYYSNENIIPFEELKRDVSGKFKWTCSECGAACEKSLRGFKERPTCYKCSRKATRKPEENYLQQAAALLNEDFILTGNIKRNDNSVILVEVKHLVCGTLMWQRPIAVKLNKCNNPQCRADSIRLGHLSKSGEDVQNALHKRIQTVHNRYGVINISQLSDIKVKKAETFEASGKPRSICHSGPEEEIRSFLQQFFDYPLKTARILEGRDIDIYIPSRNLGIEYCGIYWHASDAKAAKGHPLPKGYHREKYEAALNQGIHLIQIFEDEWLNNKDLVKAKLLQYCGINNAERIHARKCQIKPITKSEADGILLNFHTQGAANATYRLGAFYDGNLVAAMQFGKNFRCKNEEGQFELNRFATDTNYRIPGIFTKMISALPIFFPDIKTLYSFADLRWVNPLSNVYRNNGWEVVGESKPDYTYYDKVSGQRRHKSAFQKKMLLRNYPIYYDEGKSEFEITDIIPTLFRIYDCGKIKYQITIT